MNSIVENGMLPFIHQPTRIIDSSATLIDNIFSDNIEDESISGNLFIKLSDHLPQFLIINRTEDRHKQANFYKHDYQKFDKESFQDDFSLQNWANLEKVDLDASQKFDDFLWRVNSCVNRHAPLKKVGKKKLKLSLKPWITNKIIKMMHHRDRLFSKWNNDRLNAHFQNAYKKFRNRTRQEIRKSKQEYYDNYFKIHKSNLKKLWAGIQSIVNTKQRSHQLISQIKRDRKDYNNLKDTANIFNNFL